MLRLFTRFACGTPQYASPELLSQQLHNPLLDDLWALGVMLYIMLFFEYPFPSTNSNVLRRMHEKGIAFSWDGSSEREPPSHRVRDLLLGVLQFHVEERFVMRDVLLHYWAGREFARYETRRLGLPDESFPLPSEELTVLPYRLSIEKSSELHDVHQRHHIHQQQYASKSLAQVSQIGETNVYQTASISTLINQLCGGRFITEDECRERILRRRAIRFELNWSLLFYADTPEFGAKKAVLDAIAVLTKVQNLHSFRCSPAVQDAVSLLHAVLIYCNAGLCNDSQWDEICQEACVKLHVAIQSLTQLKEDINVNHTEILRWEVTT